jgi:hypothetical protein
MKYIESEKILRFSKRIRFVPIIFLFFYEIIPQATCLASNDIEIFSNILTSKINCNTLYENTILFLALIAFSILALRKIDLNIKFRKRQPTLYLALMKNKILSISIVAITGIITITSTLGITERAELFEIHQRIFANPLTYPFVHLSIFLCFVDYIIRGKILAPVIFIGIITITCIFTQSRSLIMMALLPYVLVVDKKYLFTLGMALVAVFFLRDLVNGSPVEAQELTLSGLPTMLGEFFNTWGGRRIMVDSFKTFPLEEYVTTSIPNITGIKYLLFPLYKLSAAAGLDTSDHVIKMNLLLYETFGFIGVAGSFLSDFAFFPILSLLICSFSLLMFVLLYKNEENSYIKIIVLIYSIGFIHHLFRWSATNYLTSLVGIFIALKIAKMILQSNNKPNNSLG